MNQHKTSNNFHPEFIWKMLDAIPEVIYVTDPEGYLRYTNRTGFRVFGYTEEDLGKGLHILDTLVPEARELAHNNIQKMLTSGMASPGEYQAITKNGKRFPVLIYSHPVYHQDKMLGIAGFVIDISERKKLQSELRESRERYQDIFDAIETAISVYDADSRTIVDVNKKFSELFGFSKAEALGKSIGYTSVDPDSDNYARAREQGLQIYSNHDTQTLEWQALHKDKHSFWCEVDLKKASIGSREYIIACSRDITARKAAEEALKAAQATYRITIDALGDYLFLADRELTITLINKPLMELTREYTQLENPLGHKLHDIYPFISDTAIAEYETVFKDKQPLISEREYKNKQKTWYLEVRKIPIFEGKGVSSILTVIKDISSRKNAELERQNIQEQLHKSQKMEAVGRLAGGIAHDFNNLLTAIIGNISLANNQDSARELTEEFLGPALQAANRAADLTRQLLLFSRQEPFSAQSLNLNNIINELLVILGRILEKNISIETRLTDSLPPIQGDRSKIEQVIMNLVLNARDALPNGGTITISTRLADMSETAAQNGSLKQNAAAHAVTKPDGSPEELDNGFVELLVHDDGHGMDAETRDRIFEPFFTTKAKNAGTGLGLSVVYGIIQQHKGHIQVESEAGDFTRFRICLPISPAKTRKPADIAPKETFQGDGEHILLVEDQEEVRSYIQTALTRNGYKVTALALAEEARQHLENSPESFHLLFSDIILVGEDGIQLAKDVRTNYPELPVLLATGYVGNNTPAESISFPLLAKPFSLLSLLEKVHAVLNT